MSELEDTIEYLDEDEEIVQHCVKMVKRSVIVPKPDQKSLLVERPVHKRKKKQEDDSEYDPSDDNLPPSPAPSPPARKKKVIKKMKTTPSASQFAQIKPIINVKENKILPSQNEYLNRKKYNIRIPDYDDPLCLPVRAIQQDQNDLKRLNNWNKVCLEHFKHCDTLLKPEHGETKKSVRSAVFKNVVNRHTGNSETSIWSKTTVENNAGDKKSEIFQCVLPRYKEKKVLGNFILGSHRTNTRRVVDEVVLSKEEHKGGEVLVAYKPREALSAVYTLVDKRKTLEASTSTNETKLYMRELTCCKMCAPCFHTSWRGGPREHTLYPESLICPICARTCVTIYNLLAHFKTHSSIDLHKYKKIIAKILAEIVGYHYRCRICRIQFDSIKALRKHLPEHNCKEPFKCEVGNHLVKNI